MTAFVLGDGFSPPPLPPFPRAVPSPPPPPPSPPRPRLPRAEDARIVYQEPQAVTLSTYFLGGIETDPSLASDELGNYMALTNVQNRTREDALRSITNPRRYEWADCSAALSEQGAVLPCRTADLPERCINGAEHCGTTEENTRAPWVEIDLRDGKPTDRDYYFFALEVSLPPEPHLGALFFQSSQGVSEDRGDVTNRLYEVEVFDINHNPLRTQCKPHFKQSTDFYADGMTYFQYVCLEALAEDDAYVVMRGVRFVRLTLLGEYRMLWLAGMRVEWRTLEALPPASPPPPPAPPVPPQPVAPPDAPDFAYGCIQYANYSFGIVYPVAFQEPCGLAFDECCRLAYDHNQTAAFHLSPSGCCTLLNVPEGDFDGLANVGSATVITPLVDGITSSPTVAVSGARSAVPSVYGR